MNNSERSLWIDNNEYLYRWWRLTHQSKKDFIQENKDEIDSFIKEEGGTA